MPMVIARAEDFGLTGYETREALDANEGFLNQNGATTHKSWNSYGYGRRIQISNTKIWLTCFQHVMVGQFPLVTSCLGAHIQQWLLQAAQCLASCALTPGTVADGIIDRPSESPTKVTLEHPMGKMDVIVDFVMNGTEFNHKSAGLIRTCRKIAEGLVYVPTEIWEGEKK